MSFDLPCPAATAAWCLPELKVPVSKTKNNLKTFYLSFLLVGFLDSVAHIENGTTFIFILKFVVENCVCL